MSTVQTAAPSIIKRSMAALRAAIATKDEAAVEKALTGAEAVTDLAAMDTPPAAVVPAAAGGGITINLTRDEFPPKKDDDKDGDKKKAADEANPLEARVAALETGIGEIKTLIQGLGKGNNETAITDEKILGELKEEAPPGTSDAAMSSTNDSAFLGHSFQETVALAEILAPGIQPPAFNAKYPPAQTFDSICKHRRAALAVAHAQPAMHKFIADGLKGKTFDSLTCGETRQLFKGSAAVKSAINNGAGRTADTVIVDTGVKVGKITSIADLNALGKKHYKTNN